MIEVITRSEFETIAVGRTITQRLKPLARFEKYGAVINLRGDLGAGKTVFVRGLATGLGIHSRITSPTFMIMKEYNVADYKLLHLDLYRINTQTAAETLGLNELGGGRALIAIEWPDQVDLNLPYPTLDITIEDIDEESRLIDIACGSSIGTELLWDELNLEQALY